MTARDTEDGCGWGGAFQLVAFGGKTTSKGSRDLGEWFAINHNNSMVATTAIEAGTTGVMAGDIDASHFNVNLAEGTFTSTITFCPEQKYAGLGIEWLQTLCRNDDDTRRWFFEISGPVEWIKNEMCLRENVTTGEGVAAATGEGLDGAPYVNSMVAAFKQSGMKYGKILNGCTNQTGTTATQTGSCCNNCNDNCCNDCDDCSCDCDHKVRFAELEIRLGWNGVLSDCCSIDATLGLICPTGNKNNAAIMFAPVVGNGKHWGIAWGAELQYNIWTWDEAALKVRIDTDARYLFKNEQMRSFDLVGKPWSRYMMMFANYDDAAAFSTGTLTDKTGTFGINLMTRCVDVTPGYQFNMNTGFVYKGECFLAELGTTLYARHGEKICPCWTEGPVLKSTAVAGTTQVPTNVLTHARTMDDQNAAANNMAVTQAIYDVIKITTCDVDWSSAAMPGFTAHSIYGTLGYNWGDICYPTFISVGGAYDFSQGNVALKRWTVFGKLGVSF